MGSLPGMQASVRYRAARPALLRALLGVVVATIGFVYGQAGQIRKTKLEGVPTDTERILAAVGGLVVLIGGVIAVRAMARAIRAAAGSEGEARRTGPLAFLVSVIGYVFVLLALLGTLDIPVGNILLGGALTGVIVGIAAQQSLGNFFAGIVLLIARPFSVGERVALRSGPLGGPYEGLITEMTMFYVHMLTDEGPVLLPNAGVLAAAVGPGAKDPDEEEETEPIDPGIQQGGTAAG